MQTTEEVALTRQDLAKVGRSIWQAKMGAVVLLGYSLVWMNLPKNDTFKEKTMPQLLSKVVSRNLEPSFAASLHNQQRQLGLPGSYLLSMTGAGGLSRCCPSKFPSFSVLFTLPTPPFPYFKTVSSRTILPMESKARVWFWNHLAMVLMLAFSFTGSVRSYLASLCLNILISKM